MVTTTARAVVVLVVLWLWLAVRSGAAPSCGIVTGKMVPCVGYLTGTKDDSSHGCCKGARELMDMARSKEDWQAICQCLKRATTNLPLFLALLPFAVAQFLKVFTT